MNAYDVCPGGYDKKIKFCCNDLATELDKIERMIEGEQRKACLEHINKLGPKFQDRACILAYKAQVEAQQQQFDKAEATLRTMIDKHPGNPVAYAEYALLEVDRENTAAAVERLQQAIAACEKTLPSHVYQAIGVVGRDLLTRGHIFAGRMHISMQLALAGDQDEEPARTLASMNMDARLGLYYKDTPGVRPCPDDAPYKAAHDEIAKMASRGAWQQAADKLVGLMAQYGNVPVIWWNIGTLRCYLGDDRRAAEAFSRYASLDVPLDDAVMAALYAYLFRGKDQRDWIDDLKVTVQVRDVDALLTRAQSHRALPRAGIDPAQLRGESGPPPRDVFHLLDREIPQSGEDVTLENVPTILGEALLYGRETDREPRIELLVARPEKDTAVAMLRSIAGDALGESVEEEVLEQLGAVEEALSWRWRFPEGAPQDVRKRLMTEKNRQVRLVDWTRLPLKVLDGKTPQQAATEPKYKVRLLAMILMLEYLDEGSAEPFDYNELRRALDLPESKPIEPTAENLRRLPLVYLDRVDTTAMSDDQLLASFRSAQMMMATRAVRKFSQALLDRESLRDKIDRAAIYGVMAAMSGGEGAVDLLNKAIEEAVARGKSPAPYLVRLLPQHLLRGEGVEAQQLLKRLEGHWDEPGIAQSVYSILAQFGLLEAPGRPAGRGADVARVDLAAGGAAPAAGGLILGGESAAVAAAEKKSSLWLPGE